MRIFFIKVIILFAPFFLISYITFFLPLSNNLSQSMLFSILDKIHLIETTSSPRIIFIGGSNLSLGINSIIVRDSLSLNPINTAISAGIGLKYMINCFCPYIRRNDIIIISAEYNQFFGDLADGDIQLFIVLTDILKKVNSLDYKQTIKMLTLIPKYVSLKWFGLAEEIFKKETSEPQVYNRCSFNKFGDITAHWNLSREKSIIPMGKIDGGLNQDLFTFLKTFDNDIKKRGARLYITFPCIQKTSFVFNVVQIKHIEKILRESGLTLISSPEKYKMEDSLMFDSSYHLIKTGVDLRTNNLIRDIKQEMLK